jgi:hypothetical protein
MTAEELNILGKTIVDFDEKIDDETSEYLRILCPITINCCRAGKLSLHFAVDPREWRMNRFSTGNRSWDFQHNALRQTGRACSGRIQAQLYYKQVQLPKPNLKTMLICFLNSNGIMP